MAVQAEGTDHPRTCTSVPFERVFDIHVLNRHRVLEPVMDLDSMYCICHSSLCESEKLADTTDSWEGRKTRIVTPYWSLTRRDRIHCSATRGGYLNISRTIPACYKSQNQRTRISPLSISRRVRICSHTRTLPLSHSSLAFSRSPNEIEVLVHVEFRRDSRSEVWSLLLTIWESATNSM